MKNFAKQIKILSLLLSLLILFHSCRVYHRDTVSLENAIESNKRVKIKMNDNRVLKFTKIIMENEKYYGIKSNKNSGEYFRTLLSKGELKTIRIHNKSLSIILGIVIPLLIFTGMVLLAIGGINPQIGTPNFAN